MQVLSYAIDFGTSNTLVTAAYKDRVSEPLPIEIDGNAIFKSLLYFEDDKNVKFGRSAIQEYTDNNFEGRFIRSIKKFLPDENFLGTNINNRNLSIESLIGSFLREVKLRADKQVGQHVDTVVLGRPARFSMDAKKDRLAEDRLYRAARLAGFKEVSFYAEPLAAAYDFPADAKAKKVFVIDLGAGTSDFSAVEIISKNAYKVLAMNAISVAGDAFDGVVMDSIVAPELGTNVSYRLPLTENTLKMPEDIRFRLRSPADITFLTRSDIRYFLEDIAKSHISADDKKKLEALQILLEDNLAYDIYSRIEKTKIETCQKGQSEFLYSYPGIKIENSFTLNQFKTCSTVTSDKILSTMHECLSLSGSKTSDFDLVLLTGGSCQIPFLRQEFATVFGEGKLHYSSSFTSVVKGLGIEAQKRYS